MSAQFVWLLQMMFNIQQWDLDEQIKQTSKQFNWRGGRCWCVMKSQNFRTAQAQPASKNIQVPLHRLLCREGQGKGAQSDAECSLVLEGAIGKDIWALGASGKKTSLSPRELSNFRGAL